MQAEWREGEVVDWSLFLQLVNSVEDSAGDADKIVRIVREDGTEVDVRSVRIVDNGGQVIVTFE